jgi:hypothetical protein
MLQYVTGLKICAFVPNVLGLPNAVIFNSLCYGTDNALEETSTKAKTRIFITD